MAAPPPPWSEDPLPELARRASSRPVVVLDDDPTGTQTLRDVAVLTAWDAEAIARHLDEPVVFLSTNARALPEDEAVEVTRDAARSALAAARHVGRPISIVSRSDSTLRGHFPAEPLAIAAAMEGRPENARILVAPYFGEGGRLTIDDAHYLVRDGQRINVADTEFAADPVFGYRSRSLRDWVVERHRAAYLPEPPVASLPLALIRSEGPEAVAAALAALPEGAVVVVNAEVDRDIEVVALAAAMAEEAGLPLVARAAATYVRARAGRPPAASLGQRDVAGRGRAGLIVVGSHVSLTTRQLKRLLASAMADRIDAVELPVDALVRGGGPAEAAVARGAATMDEALAAGRIGLVATERTRRDIGLAGGRAVAGALVAVVERVGRRPGWVVAKGGITSHEVAGRGLRMREARVAGQLLAGVPVWIGAEGSRWPGVPLVVFPGNVGDEDALRRCVELLAG